MSVSISIQRIVVMAGAIMLGASVMLYPLAAPAAEGPTLEPAEYKPLPVGTKVKYDTWRYVVQENDGLETVIHQPQIRRWFRTYALFGRTGRRVYTKKYLNWETDLNDKSKAAIKSLWPLEVGKKVTFEFIEDSQHGASALVRDWLVTLEVLRTEYLLLGGLRYPTYVVREYGKSGNPAGGNASQTSKAFPLEYSNTLWFNPDSGLILKSNKEWIQAEYPGSYDTYELVEVTFPKGTTTHALKGIAATVATRSASDASKDSASWEKIKYSNRVSDFQRYLEEHPSGMFVKLAESQMRSLIEREADPEAVKSQFAGIDFGAYYALIIGIDDYKNLPKLKTAVRDAKAMAAMLGNDYGFKVNMLIDPERADIIDALDEYRETLGPTDNLLIYYAGHGWLDEESGEGYWLTRNARKNRRSRWIANATITNTLKVLSAKHVMVVADSCYSGTLTRGAAAIGFRDKEYYRRMASKQARVAMVSGGLEPVADDTGKGNSPFATAFLDALRKNPDVIDGTRLFSEIRRPVILNAQQTPQYSDVRNAGHEGGDFLFVRRK